MDKREDPDSKVIPFHRTRRSRSSERKPPSRKILSDEDEFAAFSLGNLIDPEDTNGPPHPNGHLTDGAEALSESGGNGHTSPDGDHFFEQLLAETGAGATGNESPAHDSRPLPGSAHLPNELPAIQRPRRISARRLLARLSATATKRARTVPIHPRARGSRHPRRATTLTVVAAAAIGSIAAIISIADAGTTRPGRQSASTALSAQHRSHAVKPWVAYSARPRPARHRPIKARAGKPTAPTSSRSSGSTAATASSSAQAPATPQPVYQPSPAASAASSDSGSSSRSEGGVSSSGQRAGPTSVIGIGTSPSG